ncbi:MerR family transcriptional regulator [Ammoniphilus resinae]|uniref:MerR family glutamine synthetase transcriptional repressor n=1 Tax=Ammoniphilus resinae TaxID=861532 RepID=A0ABS4GTV1_9BACL|nr:MerR family transcriptional regulator [Ammoniphilus resinae]MBP1933671.1 MerR family glutamine synthetase transcriptional repressor [Ammoniphilus resinae]
MGDEIRRNMALFSIGTVIKLTELTARQIRYYEAHGLVQPARTEGNQRLFSFNDVDRLLIIKSYLEKGLNMAGIKEMLGLEAPVTMDDKMVAPVAKGIRKDMTDRELRQLLKQQIMMSKPGSSTSLISGELSRFFIN